MRAYDSLDAYRFISTILFFSLVMMDMQYEKDRQLGYWGEFYCCRELHRLSTGEAKIAERAMEVVLLQAVSLTVFASF